MMLFGEESSVIPLAELATAFWPVMLVPTRFPSTMFAGLWTRWIPSPELPETRFPSPPTPPPMSSLVEPTSMIPSPRLPKVCDPRPIWASGTSRAPMKLAWITSPEVPVETKMPPWAFPPIVLPAPIAPIWSSLEKAMLRPKPALEAIEVATPPAPGMIPISSENRSTPLAPWIAIPEPGESTTDRPRITEPSAPDPTSSPWEEVEPEFLPSTTIRGVPE